VGAAASYYWCVAFNLSAASDIVDSFLKRDYPVGPHARWTSVVPSAGTKDNRVPCPESPSPFLDPPCRNPSGANHSLTPRFL
jgi:hypothetical protein